MTAHFVDLLDALHRRSLRMAELVEDVLSEACEAVFQPDDGLARRVIRRDREVDAAEVEVETEVIRLMALYQPVGSDLRLLCTVLKINNDLERIADCAVNIAERSRHIDSESMPDVGKDLKVLGPAVQRMLHNAMWAYTAEDEDAGRQVITDDRAVDGLYGELVRKAVIEGSQASDSIAAYLDLLSVAKNLERIADHATNIAEDVIYLVTGRIVRHRKESPELPG
ncbi:MAG: phosphate signaling complex protein PhoU [Phycisphaerae bacterium]